MRSASALRTFGVAIVCLAIAACGATHGARPTRTAQAPAQLGKRAHQLVAVQLPDRSSSPAAGARETAGLLGCPSQRGLEPFGPAQRIAARALLDHYETVSLASDLRVTDPVWWPQVRADWRAAHGAPPVRELSAIHVLYAAPLSAPYPASRLGVPDLAGAIAAACGRALVRRSLVVVTGQARAPALQGASFLVDRDGRALLYFAY